MKLLRSLSPRPKCTVCGDDAPTGSDLCLRCRDPKASQSTAPTTPPSQSSQSTARPQRPEPSTRQYPRPIAEQAERVKMSFGDAMLLGSGFTLGAFLITIPIIIVLVLVLPALLDFIMEVWREANRP